MQEQRAFFVRSVIADFNRLRRELIAMSCHSSRESPSSGGLEPGKEQETTQTKEAQEHRRLFRELQRISTSNGRMSFKSYHKLPSRGPVRLGKFVLPHENVSLTTGAVGFPNYAEETNDGLFYQAPDDDEFSVDDTLGSSESLDEPVDCDDDEFRMDEASKGQDARQTSGELTTPQTVNEGKCVLETPRDGSSIASSQNFLCSKFCREGIHLDDEFSLRKAHVSDEISEGPFAQFHSEGQDARQTSGELTTPQTVNEGKCVLETPRDGSSIAPHRKGVDSRFLKDFVYRKELGKGSFGIVEECEHRLTGHRYAIKRISPKEGKSSLKLALKEVRFVFSFLL